MNGLELHTLHASVLMPRRSTKGSAGFDIFSGERVVLPKKQITKIDLPLYFVDNDVEQDYQVRVFLRSSTGIKRKLRLIDFFGELVEWSSFDTQVKNNQIYLFNDTWEDVVIEAGEHFAQFVISEKNPKKELLALEPISTGTLDVIAKHNRVVKAHFEIVEPNVYEYILDETITFEPGEQKVLASGYKGKINPGTWFGAKAHDDVKKEIFFANGAMVADFDYYNNESNEGCFFLAYINKTGTNLTFDKGDKVALLWSEKYYVVPDEIKTEKERTGGIGSTTEEKASE